MSTVQLLQVIHGDNPPELIPITLNPSQLAELPKTIDVSTTFTQAGASYWAIYSSASQTLSVYSVSISDNTAFTLVTSTKLEHPVSNLQAFKVGGEPFLLTYDAKDEYLHALQLKNSSLNPVYNGYVGNGYTTVAPMAYRNSNYVVLYNSETGAVAKYQWLVPSDKPLYAEKVWSDTWAKQWVRFAFFQMGGENFFIKTNMEHKKVNIDHFMDDPAEGSHPVLNENASSAMLTNNAVVTLSDTRGTPYFVTYHDSGEVTVNEIFASALGWEERIKGNFIKQAHTMTALSQGSDEFILLTGK